MEKLSLRTSIYFIVLVLFFNSCKTEDDTTNNNLPLEVTHGTMTDQEGNVYKTISLGGQTWMAENLRVTTYNDGTSILKSNKCRRVGGFKCSGVLLLQKHYKSRHYKNSWFIV